MRNEKTEKEVFARRGNDEEAKEYEADSEDGMYGGRKV